MGGAQPKGEYESKKQKTQINLMLFHHPQEKKKTKKKVNKKRMKGGEN